MLDEALVALARRTVVEEHDGVAAFDVVADAVLAEVAMPDWRDDSSRERVEEVLKEAVYSERGALRFVGEDQLVDFSTVTAGLALTHVLSEDEIASDRLSLDPDLGLLADWAEIDGGLHLPDGTRLRLRTRRERHAGRGGVTRITNTLAGPAGWLRSHQPGDLVVARCRDGFLELGPIAEAELVAPPRELDSRFGELFDIVNVEDGSPIEISEIVVAAAVSGWDLFIQPTRPLGELVASAGFEIEGNTMGRPGSWEDRAELSEAIGMIMRSQHMGKTESLLVSEAVKAAREAISSGAGLPRLLVQRMRQHWPACFAIYDELRRGSRPVDGAGLDRLGAATGGPVGLWLQGRAAALEGRGIVAAELAQAAVDADPAFGPAINDLAQCASDRGEARTAANLLHRVRFPDDPQLERLRDLASSQHPAVGRNDPCSCGSGRKFKHCHAGRDLLPDAERVWWLLSKAIAYLRLTAPGPAARRLRRPQPVRPAAHWPRHRHLVVRGRVDGPLPRGPGCAAPRPRGGLGGSLGGRAPSPARPARRAGPVRRVHPRRPGSGRAGRGARLPRRGRGLGRPPAVVPPAARRRPALLLSRHPAGVAERARRPARRA